VADATRQATLKEILALVSTQLQIRLRRAEREEVVLIFDVPPAVADTALQIPIHEVVARMAMQT